LYNTSYKSIDCLTASIEVNIYPHILMFPNPLTTLFAKKQTTHEVSEDLP